LGTKGKHIRQSGKKWHVVCFLMQTKACAKVLHLGQFKNRKGCQMSASEIVFTKSNFNQITSKGVSLVDFWAPWCGPCRMQGPIIEKVAEKMNGAANVGKCNVDENPEIAGNFGISSIPTILIFKDGQVVDHAVGVQPEQVLVEKLQRLAS
jgi:thioredoxin 1